MSPQKHYISRHFRASKNVLTKTRLLKHDFPVHGFMCFFLFSFPVYKKLTEKGLFAGTPAGSPGDTWPSSGKKKEHKDKLFGSGDRPVGWGSSTRRGGGQKLRARPRKFVFLGFRREESGMSQEFCRDVPDPWGCSKSLCNKNFVRIFRSLSSRGFSESLCDLFLCAFSAP